MLHRIDVSQLGPQGDAMARAVATCVHCGFCLPACPTYRVLGEEMDSPRGRIFLMKGVLEGDVALSEVVPHVDRCLGCLACVPACPSGVAYGDLLTPFRAHVEPERARSVNERLRRALVLGTLPYAWRFRQAMRLGRFAGWLRAIVPRGLRPMLDMVPERLPPAQPLPSMHPAQGTRRARVALLAGCAQQVLAPEIGWAALRVLARAGVEVVVPPKQGCCGALAMHVGEADQARRLARRNLRAFPTDVDAIITTAAGCGSGMHEYSLLFKGLAEESDAERLASQVTDVTVFLEQLDLGDLPPLPAPLRVAYHDACHLVNAQGVSAAPRALLGRIPNLTLVKMPEPGMCCGSAGTYNIDQPEIAHELGQRKAKGALAADAQAVATGNIGCVMQLRTHLAALGARLPVYHTIEIVDRALTQGVRGQD
ncbi:MAG: 4Fe-4S dicluster domain-containing protein [Luteitalea sp.]|nr:4Fe-4S dicluster domain-containing protein [Luteitalea sp.]